LTRDLVTVNEPAETAGLPPLRPADDHVDLATAAAGANEPGFPVEHGRLRTIAGGLLGGIGLDL
jgi:hypothetical protein